MGGLGCKFAIPIAFSKGSFGLCHLRHRFFRCLLWVPRFDIYLFKQYLSMVNGVSWFPIKGDRYHIILQLAVYTACIPLIHCLLGDCISPIPPIKWNQKQLLTWWCPKQRKTLSNIHHDPEDTVLMATRNPKANHRLDDAKTL